MNLGMTLMLLCSAVAALVEIYLLQRIAASPSDWIIPVVIHLALCAGLFAMGGLSKIFQGDKTWPWITAMTVAVAGPIGAIGSLAAILLTAFHRRKASSFEEWYESLFPDSIDDFQFDLMARIRANDSGEGQGVSAFADILAFGTIAQKQELITLVTKHFEPRFAGVLKLALDDANNATRVQAASSVAKITDDFMSRGLKLQRDAANGEPRRILALAKHYDEHGKTGLLDPEGSEVSRTAALEAYQRYLGLEPADVDARAAVGRLMLKSGDLQATCAWLKESVEGGAAPGEGAIAYMEALFRLGRFSDLREVAQLYVSQAGAWDVHDESIEIVRLWAEGYDPA
jgi:hypothetical protein